MIVATKRAEPAPAGRKPALPEMFCNLPTFRPVALKMLKVLSRENADFREVTRVLEADPGFAAEILTLANSVMYGGYGRVDTLLRAMVVLGVERVKSLTMTVAMRAFLRNLPPTAELQNCWGHSRACALAAEELAALYGIQRDRAYTAGLMHDVGRFGMLAGSTDTYGALLASGFGTFADALRAERESFGFDHCEAGEMLARTWRLPPELAEVTAQHHGQDGAAGTVGLVRAACGLAGALGFAGVRYREGRGAAEILEGLPGRGWEAEEFGARLQEKFHALDLV